MPRKMQSVLLSAVYSRRLPDPVFKDRNAYRHIFYCKAKEIPEGLPKDPNPRNQNINRAIYREIAKSLREEDGTPGTFHLKNKGITIIAEEVRQKDEHKEIFELLFADDATQGIVDGGHTYEILRDNRLDCPEDQHVRVEVLTGIDEDWIPELAGGLNTGLQVQEISIAELERKFDWIKSALANQPYANEIAYRENEDCEFDARDVVALLTLFNISHYPTDGSKREYPIKAYSGKASTLEAYLHDLDSGDPSFPQMKGILPEILELHDLVHLEAREQWNKMGGRAGSLAFGELRERKPHKLIFVDKETDWMLYDGALYPMLGAFRWMVELDKKGGAMKWKGGFSAVRSLLESVAAELIASTKDVSDKYGRNPNKIGKDRGHWENLFKSVALQQIQTMQK